MIPAKKIYLDDEIGFMRTRRDRMLFDIADCSDKGQYSMAEYYKKALPAIEFAIDVLEAKNKEIKE